MLKITDDYLEDEIRDGFYIPSMTKRTWAMELTVLDLIDEICRKHDITYFADWGTYLGAVRHGGFVPWDDDLDLCMHRNEFEKFKTYAEKEMPEGYSIITFHNNDYSWKFIVNVAPNDRMNFTPEYLKSHYSFPYIVGIDIFIIDNINDDNDIESSNKEKIKKLLSAADTIDAYTSNQEILNTKIIELEKCSGKISKDTINNINNILIYARNELGLDVNASMPVIEVKRVIYTEVENILKAENKSITKNVIQKIPWGIYHDKSFPKDYFKESTRIPFEMLNISVPLCYDRGMRIKYGDYMRIVMGAGGHDYPYYIGQKASLGEEFDYPLLYKYNESDLNIEKDFTGSLKSVALEIKAYLKESLGIIEGIVSGMALGTNEYSFDEVTGFLADIQDNVIQFGGLIESVKGEGTGTVSQLEKFCEKLFMFSQAISGNDEVSVDNADAYLESIKSSFDALQDCITDILSNIDTEIINRRIVMFFPVKAKYWNSLKPIYEKEIRDSNTDVFVVPLPYYYKEYDGSFKSEAQYEGNEIENLICEEIDKIDAIRDCQESEKKSDYDNFQTSVNILHYDNCNLSLICPDVIYINNPYDEFNMSSSVPQYYYAKNLKKYTEQLVYVPFFKSMEFEKSNYPCWYNMQYYCTVPGVVIADEVWVQSEGIRARYIEKLDEWSDKSVNSESDQNESNEEGYTSEIKDSKWSSKIKVITDIYPEYFDVPPAVPNGLKTFYEDAKNNHKKIMVFYINAGTIVEYEDAYFEKMNRCLGTFKESKDKISIIMTADFGIIELLSKHRVELFGKWQQFVDEFKSAEIGIYANDVISKEEMSMLVGISDAYYGNPSVVCKDFELAKKPVMIQAVEI